MKKFGHYEVTEELGRGGMGVVYKGWEPSLNRRVAIKCLGEHLLNDKDLVERFTREAKATAALNNPNVIQIYYIGTEHDQPYFAMEYIEGQSLDDILKGGNSLSVKHAKNLLKQACLGLSAAHKIDLVHRDIKPANIMLTDEGTLKIVDFGIARTREYGDKLTNTGEFVGTPGYLSPEVCIGKEVDERSDIFSLGIVFYEMLSGKVPFENDSPLGLMLEVVQSDIPDIRALNKKVDKKTSYILNKMIAKSPDDRYQNCDEIIRDLGVIMENQNIEMIKKAAVTNRYVTTKNKISEQVTLPRVAAVTQNNLMVTKQQNNNAKWLVAATLFVVLGAAGFGYYKGYIPLPSMNDNTAQNNSTMGLVDGDLLIAGSSGSVALDDEDNNISVDPIDESNQDEVSDSHLAVSSTQYENPEDVSDLAKENLLENKEQVIHNTDKIENADLSDDQASFQISNMVDLEETENLANVSGIDNQRLAEPKNRAASMMMESGQEVADSTNKVTSMLLETDQQIASIVNNEPMSSPISKSVNKSRSVAKKKYIPLNKGVVVIAFGDPAIANPVEKILENQLKSQGIKVMNEQFIPGMRNLVEQGLDLAELKMLIEKNGGQAMVIANVNYVGSQELQYSGRSSELINAQLDIDTYDIKSGDSIGNGFGSKINYTSLNATDQASDAVMKFTNQITANLKGRI